FSVRDTGAGIPAALLDTVFERFHQVGKRDQRGLGLVLYISRCIVESHGGRLWVDSTLGAGSTFHFTIPDAMARAPDVAAGRAPSTPSPRSAPAPAPSTASGGVALARLRVLIVDDDPAMGETLATCLSRRGFEAMSRTSTHDAVTLVESIAFDAIVTDLHMDGLDGLGLCAWVARVRPGLPVIVTTGFGSSETRAAAVLAGAFEFLTKPVDVDLLRATVERACAARSPDRG
ncbi:MAG: response regulator, partial [Proteobacteria bacterium]|nr:response regulator [Pseudomonadota bacterium]